jgi:hypothetical protein
MANNAIQIPELHNNNYGLFNVIESLARVKITKTFDLLNEVLQKYTIEDVVDKLFIHRGTINRWISTKKVPDNYYGDLNELLENKYPQKESSRDKDQFFTNKNVSEYCYKKTLEILKEFEIDIKDYTFIEPSAGCCNFYEILPENKRIGIDIEPKGYLQNELIKKNYLNYIPKEGRYIVIGNPPFGLRGNLALRFINHSYKFADVVAFILPPLFNSTGKGVPMTRVKGYKLAHTEPLPLKSFEYPDGTEVEVATIFQVWIKINTDKIKNNTIKNCNSFIKIYSLSDGGTPSSSRNKNMLNKCNVYLPSTCFKGMKAYKTFEELPNRRGYGIVFLKNINELNEVFYDKINWQEVAFLSTNSAINLRTDLIQQAIINKGFYDR